MEPKKRRAAARWEGCQRSPGQRRAAMVLCRRSRHIAQIAGAITGGQQLFAHARRLFQQQQAAADPLPAAARPRNTAAAHPAAPPPITAQSTSKLMLHLA